MAIECFDIHLSPLWIRGGDAGRSNGSLVCATPCRWRSNEHEGYFIGPHTLVVLLKCHFALYSRNRRSKLRMREGIHFVTIHNDYKINF